MNQFYIVPMFPYPSGNIHLGHARNYITSDVIARYQKMIDKDVIHPIGWDAFGLPAENAAIANDKDPSDWTQSNIQKMKEQLESMNIDFNWEREIQTNDPNYFKWTQWFFIQMFKNGIAYQDEQEVNWDSVDQTVLANEQVDAQGRGWRSGAVVERKNMKQWFIKTTAYKQEMIDDLDRDDFMPPQAKSIQRSWLKKLHDWGVSRQRYWGTPIPMIYFPEHGAVPVPDDQLPVVFPDPKGRWVDFRNQIDEWKVTTCPICGKESVKSTETMDTFMDSTWYFYRYLDNKNSDRPFDTEKVRPMDVYIGGIEHANAHLIYARFFTKFLRDIGMMSFDKPFTKYIPIGVVQGKTYKTEDGQYIPSDQVESEDSLTVSWEKMSKSKGNGVTPQEIINRHGIEVFRMYLMFKAPIEKQIPWDEQGIQGIKRFIQKVNRIESSGNIEGDSVIEVINRQFDKKYHSAMVKYNFNVAISMLMAWYNNTNNKKDSSDKDIAINSIKKYVVPFVGNRN